MDSCAHYDLEDISIAPSRSHHIHLDSCPRVAPQMLKSTDWLASPNNEVVHKENRLGEQPQYIYIYILFLYIMVIGYIDYTVCSHCCEDNTHELSLGRCCFCTFTQTCSTWQLAPFFAGHVNILTLVSRSRFDDSRNTQAQSGTSIAREQDSVRQMKPESIWKASSWRTILNAISTSYNTFLITFRLVRLFIS